MKILADSNTGEQGQQISKELTSYLSDPFIKEHLDDHDDGQYLIHKRNTGHYTIGQADKGTGNDEFSLFNTIKNDGLHSYSIDRIRKRIYKYITQQALNNFLHKIENHDNIALHRIGQAVLTPFVEQEKQLEEWKKQHEEQYNNPISFRDIWEDYPIGGYTPHLDEILHLIHPDHKMLLFHEHLTNPNYSAVHTPANFFRNHRDYFENANKLGQFYKHFIKHDLEHRLDQHHQTISPKPNFQDYMNQIHIAHGEPERADLEQDLDLWNAHRTHNLRLCVSDRNYYNYLINKRSCGAS